MRLNTKKLDVLSAHNSINRRREALRGERKVLPASVLQALQAFASKTPIRKTFGIGVPDYYVQIRRAVVHHCLLIK